MTKKIKKLEKETKSWKERWEGANKALLEMVAERGQFEKKLETQTRQNNKLQGLCRALQKEVTELRSKEKGKVSVSFMFAFALSITTIFSHPRPFSISHALSLSPFLWILFYQQTSVLLFVL